MILVKAWALINKGYLGVF